MGSVRLDHGALRVEISNTKVYVGVLENKAEEEIHNTFNQFAAFVAQLQSLNIPHECGKRKLPDGSRQPDLVWFDLCHLTANKS